MVEPLKELNKICQKPNYKMQGNWMVRHILRDAALPMTWLLLHTRITANQVTLIALLAGVLGISFFAFPGSSAFLLGTLLMQLWYYLDHVDGQIARYRKTASLSGRFFDFIMHHLIHGIVLFSLGFYAYIQTGWPLLILLGFLGSFSTIMFNLANDTKCKTFLEKMSVQNLDYRISSIQLESDSTLTGGAIRSKMTFPKRLFSFAHKVSEIHVLMNVMTVCALLVFIAPLRTDLRIELLFLYAPLAVFLAVTKITYLIVSGKVDEDFQNHFQLKPGGAQGHRILTPTGKPR